MLQTVPLTIVGFRINNYIPLSHRVLKQIGKMKHLAEKKRLLYVALTRAEHDVVISALLKEKKDGDITLREDSYLSMITNALGIETEELYGQNMQYCLTMKANNKEDAQKRSIKYIDHTMKPITFTQKSFASATKKEEGSTEPSVHVEAAKLGTITHKILERYWQNFNEYQEAILSKMGVFDAEQRKAIVTSMQKFYESDLYLILQDDVEHYFELEFNVEGKTGFIDFLYFDKEKEGWVIVDFKTGTESFEKNEQYQEQLVFYKTVMEYLGYKIVDTQLLWL